MSDREGVMDGTTGVGLIMAERRRQKEEEGYTLADDDRYTADELVRAAACYLEAESDNVPMLRGWPWKRKEWKPADRIRNLVRAGALVAAEIDRLQRLAGRLESRKQAVAAASKRAAEECRRMPLCLAVLVALVGLSGCGQVTPVDYEGQGVGVHVETLSTFSIQTPASHDVFTVTVDTWGKTYLVLATTHGLFKLDERDSGLVPIRVRVEPSDGAGACVYDALTKPKAEGKTDE